MEGHHVAGAQTAAPPQSTIKTLMTKKNAFMRLKEWEHDWDDRTKNFNSFVEPAYLEVVESVQRAKQVNQEIVRCLKERVKVDSEYAKNIRSISVQKLKLSLLGQAHDAAAEAVASAAASSSTRQSVTTSTTATTATQQQTDEDGGSSTTTSVIPGLACGAGGASGEALGESFLKLQPIPWFQALSQMHMRQATSIENFASFVDSFLVGGQSVGGLLQKTVEEFEKNANQNLSKMKEARSKMRAQDREVAKLWIDYERMYLQNEKIDLDTKIDKQFKDHKDCWLYERRFILGAGQSRHLQREFFKTLATSIEELQKLEGWRSENFQNVLNKFVWRSRDMLGSIASAVGSAHAMIDPQGYSKARAAFHAQAKHTAPSTAAAVTTDDDKQRSAHTTLGAPTEDKGIEGGNSPLPSEEVEESTPTALDALPNNAATTTADSKQSLAEQSEEEERKRAVRKSSDETGEGAAIAKGLEGEVGDDGVVDEDANVGEWICELIGLSLKDKTMPTVIKNQTFVNAARTLDYELPPESLLIIKQGTVIRQSGFGSWQQKWSNGMLVLTWDRYLHMFRSHDDANPVWSTCMHYVELRRTQEKAGPITVELREKKNSFILAASKSNFFRALSDAELTDWLKCLALACSGDDLQFTARALTACQLRESQRKLARPATTGGKVHDAQVASSSGTSLQKNERIAPDATASDASISQLNHVGEEFRGGGPMYTESVDVGRNNRLLGRRSSLEVEEVFSGRREGGFEAFETPAASQSARALRGLDGSSSAECGDQLRKSDKLPSGRVGKGPSGSQPSSREDISLDGEEEDSPVAGGGAGEKRTADDANKSVSPRPFWREDAQVSSSPFDDELSPQLKGGDSHDFEDARQVDPFAYSDDEDSPEDNRRTVSNVNVQR